MSQPADNDAPTWRDIAAAYPTTVQEYVQRFGPLPEGQITQEAWDLFRSGECVTPPASSDPH